MDNQHRKIVGYRELSQSDIDLMNKIKHHGENLKLLMEELEGRADLDQMAVAAAKLQLQTGIMWAVRSVAQPSTF